MSTAPLDLKVAVIGADKLDKLVKRMGVLEDEVKKVNGELPKTVKGIKGVGRASKGAATGVNSLSKAFKGLVSGLAVIGITKAVLELGKGAAKTQAEIDKLGIALRGVLGDDTKKGLEVISKAARDFAIPLEDATRNFTQLSAAGVTNGNTVKELETLYRGLAAATKATGGNAEDLNGTLRAATQVISKGKVQAEELRGQIGDRLPGAFQLFAQATNRTTAELQKALELGTVSAEEFVTDFGRFIKDKYEPAAKRIGDSPAEAGARLTKSLEDLNLTVGPLLASIGAKFQNFANNVIKNALEPIARYLKDFVGFLENTDAGYVKALGKLAAIDKQIGIKEAAILQATDKRTRTALQSDLDYLEGRREKALKDVNTILSNSPTAPLGTTNITNPNKDNPLTETVDKTTKSVEKLLGIDWDKLIGLEEARLQLKITEQQGQALLDGNKVLYDRLEATRSTLRTKIEIEELTKGIAEAEARVVKYANDEVLSAEAQNQLQNLKNAKLERELDLRNDLATAGNDAFKKDLEAANAFGKIVQGVKPLNDELTKTEELLKGSFDIAANGLTSAIQGLINGTEKWNDVLSNVLNSLSSLFLNAAFSSLGQGLKIPGYADGGRPQPGQVSLVGERGPELFVSDSPGTVLSSDQAFDAARAAMTSGSANSAFDQNSNSISSTTNYLRGVSELRAQEQAASAMSSSNESITFETYSIGGLDVVTKAEAIAIGNASAKKARAEVFSDMKNRPAIRRQAGIR